MKSGYVVKGCTVRGYWNTAKRIAVQIRYRTGTEVRHLQGEAGGGEKKGPAAPLSHHRGGLSDRVHLEGWGKIPKQAAGCHTPQDPALKPPQKRCKLSGSKCPVWSVETPPNAIQAAIS